MQTDRVCVVSVAFGSFDVLPAMANSLPRGTPLVIVDNGTDDGLRDWAKERGHDLRLPGKNIGFGAACNLGAQGATAEFLFFLNPDARLAEGALEALLDAADRHPGICGFGPAILREDGSVFSVNPSIIIARSQRGKRGLRPETEVPRPSLNGAALLIRRAAFEAVGGFDPDIFLYFEDDDLTLRLARDRGGLLYVPQARVIHASGGSTQPSAGLARFKGYHYARSYIHVLGKHGRRWPWAIGAWDALRRCLSLRFWTRADKRNDAIGRWRGVMSMRARR